MTNEALIIDLAKDWTDYVKLGAEILGPTVTAVFGYWIFRITKGIEQSQWRNQKLIEKRLEVWDEVAPKLNDVYCYCMRVGSWKDFSPKEVISWKRGIDKIIHTNRPYFSPEFFKCYQEFMDVCFAIYQGHGIDAKLMTPVAEHRSAHKNWLSEWDDCFHPSFSTEKEITSKYLSLQSQLSAELKANSK